MVGIGLVAAGIDALLGFENEVARFVEIEEVGGGGAVGFLSRDGAFEGVVVERGVLGGRGRFFEI